MESVGCTERTLNLRVNEEGEGTQKKLMDGGGNDANKGFMYKILKQKHTLKMSCMEMSG